MRHPRENHDIDILELRLKRVNRRCLCRLGSGLPRDTVGKQVRFLQVASKNKPTSNSLRPKESASVQRTNEPKEYL